MNADVPWDLLRSVDTPTVCNAIEVAQGRRGFAGFTRGTPVASVPGAIMVGYARTARIRGRRPPDAPPTEIRARRMAYFEHMAAGPRPSIAVIEDEDDAPFGAWWGEVHVAVHAGLGLCGALTNGLLRDLGDLRPDFPVVAGALGPSHGFVHVTAIGTGATCSGSASRRVTSSTPTGTGRWSSRPMSYPICPAPSIRSCGPRR